MGNGRCMMQRLWIRNIGQKHLKSVSKQLNAFREKLNGKILNNFPPALVLGSEIGYAVNPCEGIEEEPEEVYTILYSGAIDFKVSGSWLIKL